MAPSRFDYLLSLVEKRMTPKINRKPNDVIPPKEKLCITLEFFASGTLQRHLASVYRISKQHLGTIFESSCEIIFDVLEGQYLQEPTSDQWNNISSIFHGRWNFPNCLGAIDGKHVAIKCPSKSGSAFYNYKGFHSIVIMAIADADSRFLCLDIGASGSEGDSNVFSESEFGASLMNNKMKLPEARKVHGKTIDHFFLADDAFPLHKAI